MLLRTISNGIGFCGRSAAFLQLYRNPTTQRHAPLIQSTYSLRPRYFASSSDSEEKKSKRTIKGPMSWLSFGITAAIGGLAIYFVKRTKQRKDDEIAQSLKKYTGTMGKSLIGGPWELVNYDNRLVSFREYLGKWVIIYFGFTHCPDICPEELEKLVNVIENLKKDPKMPKIYPLFFTVDPYRDTPEKIKPYCQEYSPDLVGFSGTVEQVSKVCKTFRVYFSEGPKVDSEYIMDHSIIMYLMNPDHEFVEHYTRETPEKRMEIKVRKAIQAYEEKKK